MFEPFWVDEDSVVCDYSFEFVLPTLNTNRSPRSENRDGAPPT